MKKLFKTLMIMALCGATMGIVSCKKDSHNVSDGYVDLGLPSGLLWATCNLGATTPEGYGDYYAWGETSTKNTYNWSTCRYATVDADGNLQTLTKYNTLETYGTVDNKTTLEAADDAATAVLGSGARIPTKAEWQELLDNTTAEWTTQNGVNGRKFTASNGNSLFLPAAGYLYESEQLSSDGVNCFYWSSSLRTNLPSFAKNVYFYSVGQRVGYNGRRFVGEPVRAVRSQD